jgi:GNAT superfamily N-acetyltransferase
VPRSDPDKISVNVRCLEGVDPDALAIDAFDGTHWEQAIGSASWKAGGIDVDVRREDLASPVAGALIAALNAELTERLSRGGRLSLRARRPPRSQKGGARSWWPASTENRGLRGDSPDRRRDRRDQAHVRGAVVRGRGIGARLLAALEAEARRLQLLRIVLETGERQPEALAVYRRAGYVVIPAFGEYIGTPLSLCMEKRLR